MRRHHQEAILDSAKEGFSGKSVSQKLKKELRL